MPHMMKNMILASLLALTTMQCTGAFAAPSLELVIKSRQFAPQTLHLPAGQKVQLSVQNQDAIPVEFESYDLSREVIVPPGGKVNVYVGPLKPGKYAFFDDFNPAAKGWILVDTLNSSGDQ